MKKLLFSLLTLTILVSCSTPDPEYNMTDEDFQGIMSSIIQLNEAFEVADEAKLSSLITKDYQHTNGKSKAIGKTAWLNYIKKRKAQLDSGTLKVLEYATTESELKFYGNTGIYTAKIIVKSEFNGEVKTNAYRVTHTWIRENDKWKRAAFQDTKIF